MTVSRFPKSSITTKTYFGGHVAHQTQQDGGFADRDVVVHAEPELEDGGGKDEQEGVGVDGEDDCTASQLCFSSRERVHTPLHKGESGPDLDGQEPLCCFEKVSKRHAQQLAQTHSERPR